MDEEVNEGFQLEDWRQCQLLPKAGKFKGPIFCGVCGTKMDEQRDCEGPTTSVEAMAGCKRKYDMFTCPHSSTAWHRQVISLRQAADLTPSAQLAKVYESEAKELLITREATKKRDRLF